MQIVIFSKRGGQSRSINLRSPLALGLLGGGFAALAVALAIGGYQYGLSRVGPEAEALRVSVIEEVGRQREELQEFRRGVRENMDALARRLGEMQAHVIRLDALGERLADMAHLDTSEFSFEQPPAQGGPEASGARETMAVPDFLAALDLLDKQLADRSQKLSLLEGTLMDRRLQAEVLPAGRPTKSGWISSFFGMRTDPFSGRPAHHDGIDVAGKLGSDVIAVASGVVTWSGDRYGFGNLVEINHGNGYVTRYAHNLKNLVEVGQTVKKGEVVAEMGTSGRSTGPHVHFEVLMNGRQVDPAKFVRR